MAVEFLPSQSFINLTSLSTSSKAPRFSPEAAPKYLKVPKSIQLKCTSRKLCFAMGQRTPHEVESRVGHKDGVIIVDHGSRRKESNLLLNEFVLMFKSKTGYAIVEPAHMELAEPTIRDAFGSCVEQGANRVIISPFFLFPGRHWHQDIPSLAEAAAKEHPGILYLVTAPLGLHELLVDVVKDRIEYCLSRVDGQADECSVCAGTGRCQLKVKEPETRHSVRMDEPIYGIDENEYSCISKFKGQMISKTNPPPLPPNQKTKKVGIQQGLKGNTACGFGWYLHNYVRDSENTCNSAN